jgi:ectoine hydroxylase-related dioxygenase (phytanoyl-CoA dioxygenase family)
MSSIVCVPQLEVEEIDKFHEQGYLGPYTLRTPERMAAIRDHIEMVVLMKDGPNKASREHARHLDSRVMYDLCADTAITHRVASLLGPDIVLWSSNFWTKKPGGKEVPWHQDINYWPLDPPLNVTAWLAIDEVTVENSCVRIIPGSHKKMLPHIRIEEGKWFDEGVDMSCVDESKAVDMELKPGEFFIFSERLLHQSNPNRSAKRRMGLSIRMTTPFVKVYHDQSPPLFPGHKNIMILGEDRIGVNQLAAVPVS